MGDYTLANNWAAKEAAASAVDGDDYQTEFEAVQTAVNSKTERVPAPTNGNVVKMDSAGDLVDSGLPAAKVPNVSNTVAFEKDAVFTSVVSTSGSSGTIDWSAGNKQHRTMTGNGTLAFTNPGGVCNLVLRVFNSGGSRTITWPSTATVRWPNGGTVPSPSATSKYDIYMFFFDGSIYWGSMVGDY